jgi:hypothetical protein
LSLVTRLTARLTGSALTTTSGTGEDASHVQVASDSWLDAMMMPVDAAVDHEIEIVHRPAFVVGGA